MGGLTLYRHDHRDIPDSDPMPPAGDHYKELTPEQKMAEDAIRVVSPMVRKFVLKACMSIQI
jgi:hypothetical protein